jgi:hypothetical protein
MLQVSCDTFFAVKWTLLNLLHTSSTISFSTKELYGCVYRADRRFTFVGVLEYDRGGAQGTMTGARVCTNAP